MAYFLPPPDRLPESRHAAVGGWFFGPRAENFDFLREAFNFILDGQQNARTSIYPHDEEFITKTMKESTLYKDQIDKIRAELSVISHQLSQHSVPFWSPRYNAHMSMESSMPATIGYLTGLLHNQNNVATEASPITTLLENEVGKDLCRMLGYDPTHAWGHITCGGSVANLESIWAARNLKFYPLSLKLAIEASSLSYLADVFEVELCTGKKKKFVQCDTWELLNLKPSTVLNIPDQLFNDFGVSQTALTNAFSPFSIQTVGKDYLEKQFNIKSSPQMFVGTTKHYSWPKGAAIAGIGSGQIIDVPVDNQARMDPAKLREMLEAAVSRQTAIYSVVAIIGSTEQGAVDPLTKVLELREEFEREKGLSFVVHCDGAWGGYFASCIRDPTPWKHQTDKGTPEYVPQLTVSPYTREQLENLGKADSITIDPHKSGYCPYPAGGLCYQDGRMRYLVTWTSPIVYHDGSTEPNALESIGVYGVEGSKPGAAAVGAYLSHRVIGLHRDGYGTLLGEAILTCTRLYCHWATMDPVEVDIDPQNLPGVKGRLTVTPFTMLPAERDGGSKEDVKKQKQFIRDYIIGKDNEEVFQNDDAVKLLAQLGGDLQINAFACNFEIDGKLNKDVVEANYLNTQIFNRTSVTQPGQKLSDYPLYLTSSQFAQSAYQGCLDTYKRRMGVEGPQDLYTLVNVTMGPWSTSYDFVQTLAKDFERIAQEEMKAAVRRNVQTPDFHGFVVQGFDGDRICGVHLPMFNMQNHRWQLIISCKLPKEAHEELLKQKQQDPSNFFTFGNTKAHELMHLIKDGASFEARLDKALPANGQAPIATVKISDVKVLYQRSMLNQYLSATYPDSMIFYAYSAQHGTDDKPIFNIDKLLNVSPNIQLNAETVTFKTDNQKEAEKLVRDSGCWFRLVDVHESTLQPLLQKKTDPNTEYINPGFKFVPGAHFAFEALAVDGNNPPQPDAKPIFTGTLTLGSSVFADYLMLNMDGGADHRDENQDKKTKEALEGLPTANTSAMVAEYPNDLTTLELRNTYQQAKMQNFAAHFARAGVEQAQKMVEDYEGRNEKAPKWASEWAKEGNAVSDGPAPTGTGLPFMVTKQMYHS